MNEDNIQDDALYDASDRVQDSENDIPIEDTEEIDIDSVEETTEEPEEEVESTPIIELTDYTETLAELKVLQEESNAM